MSCKAAQRPVVTVIFDASVLIGHLGSNDLHHVRAMAPPLETTGGRALGASAITRAETLVAPARQVGLRMPTAAIGRLGVQELALGENAPFRLAWVRADVGRKLPDCCVLLASQMHAGSAASFDVDLLTAARPLGLHMIE